jgi:hypothetical protein
MLALHSIIHFKDLFLLERIYTDAQITLEGTQDEWALTFLQTCLRCYYIALSFLSGQKWAEAMALFQRATAYASKAKNDKYLPGEPRPIFMIRLIFFK